MGERVGHPTAGLNPERFQGKLISNSQIIRQDIFLMSMGGENGSRANLYRIDQRRSQG